MFHQVHNPLLSRLTELAQQRPFYEYPKIAWLTSNYLDVEYLARLTQLAGIYGAKFVVLDDSYFDWLTIPDRISVENWLADLSQKMPLGILVSASAERKFLEDRIFHRWPQPLKIFVKNESKTLDAVSTDFGGGHLPFLQMDHLVPVSLETSLLRIDQPGFPGDSLATWGNVFGVSYHCLTGDVDSAKIESEYLQLCFGSDLHEAFASCRNAIGKSFRVLDSMWMMDKSRWPGNLAWLDAQASQSDKLCRPSRDILNQIGMEKIEGLESAHDALQNLDRMRNQIPPTAFLFLEHYFHQLRLVCTVLWRLTDVYFSLFAREQSSATVGSHEIIAKFKDFKWTVEEYASVLSSFDSRYPAAGAVSLMKLAGEINSRIGR